MSSAISIELQAFLHDYIKSVEQAEILLLLFGTSPREWNAVRVSRELRIDAVSAARRLSDLQLCGLLSARAENDTLHYWYEGASDPLVRELARELAERPTSLISAIYSPPPRPAQSEQPPQAGGDVLAFADAFRLRREGPK